MIVKCPICNARYETLGEMARCIIKDEERQKQKEEQEHLERLLEEKQSRYKALKNEFENFLQNVKKYEEDYNELTEWHYIEINKSRNLFDWFIS